MSSESIQYTNDEATATKAYAVRIGYWSDPYIKIFCPFPTSSTPEISRGYYVRVQTFEAIVNRFIQVRLLEMPLHSIRNVTVHVKS